MKLFEITQMGPGLEQEATNGTYVGYRLGETTAEALISVAHSYGVDNTISPDDIHVTLIYSRKELPDFEPLEDLDSPIIGSVLDANIWETDYGNTLLITFQSTELYNRHHFIRNEYGATHDYDDYHPHVTLSYDIGDTKVSLEQMNKDLSILVGKIELVHEYKEALNLEWVSN